MRVKSKIKSKNSKKTKGEKQAQKQADIVFVQLSPAKNEKGGNPGRTAERVALEFCKRKSRLKSLDISFVRLLPEWVKDPKKKDVEPHIDKAKAEIKKLKPKIVVFLGKDVAQYLNKTKKIQAFRGFWNIGLAHFELKAHCIVCWSGPELIKMWSRVYDQIRDFNEIAKVLKRGKIKRVKYETFPDKKKYVFCTNLKKVKQALKECSKSKFVVFDVETTGFHFWKNEILCIGLSPDHKKSFVIPLRGSRRLPEGSKPQVDRSISSKPFWSDKKLKKVMKLLKEFFSNPDIEFGAQNRKFDEIFHEYLGIKPVNVGWCTMAFARLENENRLSNLNYLMQRYNIPYGKYDEALYDYIPRDEKTEKNYSDIPNEVTWLYCCVDVDITRQIAIKQKKIIKDDPRLQYLMYEVQMPMTSVFQGVEYRGVKINAVKLNGIAKVFQLQVKTLDAKLRKLLKKHPACKGLDADEFNWNSGPQKKKLLFERLCLPMYKTTKSGGESTDADSLKKICDAKGVKKIDKNIAMILLDINRCDSIVTNLLGSTASWRKSGKSVGYVGYMDDKNFAHTAYQTDYTKTGRLSSRGINLQNVRRGDSIPKITGEALKLGKDIFGKDWDGSFAFGELFVPHKKGNKILSLDYKALELRIIMWLSGDQNGLKEFKKGKDMHIENACLFFKKEAEDVTPEERHGAKTSGFSQNYCGGPRVMREMTGCSYDEAIRRTKLYFGKYSRIKPWWAESIEIAKTQGYIENYFGRRRTVGLGFKFFRFLRRNIRGIGRTSSVRWIDALQGHLERQICNFPVQSFAADLMNLRIVALDKYLKSVKDSRIILQVHDDVTIDTPKKGFKEVRTKALEILEWRKVKSPSWFVKRKGKKSKVTKKRKKKIKLVDFLVEHKSGSHWQH